MLRWPDVSSLLTFGPKLLKPAIVLKVFTQICCKTLPSLRPVNSSKAWSQMRKCVLLAFILTYATKVSDEARQACRMSEACLKKFHQHFFPACPWSSSMKEVYFGESSILDLSIGAARPSLTSLLLWQPLPCFVSSSSKAVIICGPWRLKKTCWVKSKLQAFSRRWGLLTSHALSYKPVE